MFEEDKRLVQKILQATHSRKLPWKKGGERRMLAGLPSSLKELIVLWDKVEWSSLRDYYIQSMDFINRTAEILRLNKALHGKSPVFIVVYGRRRCGKSRLIKQVLKPNDIYFMADQSDAAQQIALFSKVLGQALKGFDKIIYPNWNTLLENLNDRLSKKITICLDEFPYLVKSEPELPSIIQKIMDDREHLNFNLVICGSSQQLMQGLVLDSSTPLYGRADEIMKINPMRSPYIQEALSCSPIKAIEEYSVWGGVPRYWELRLAETDLFAALSHHLLSSYGVLYDEPIRLFLDDMQETAHSFTILSLIASGCHRLSEIAGRLGKPATHLSRPLEKLLSLGYIEREVPYGESHKNTKRSLYKISDPFLNFYFRFVVPNRSFIETEQKTAVLLKIKEQFPGFVSFCWEKLCRDAVSLMHINGLSFKPAHRWWGGRQSADVEFDIVADSLDGKFLLVGECKWSDAKINAKELLANLVKKIELADLAEEKTVVPVLFLKKQIRHSSDITIFYPKDVLSAYKNIMLQ